MSSSTTELTGMRMRGLEPPRGSQRGGGSSAELPRGGFVTPIEDAVVVASRPCPGTFAPGVHPCLDASPASAPACTVKQLSISGGFGGATGSPLGGVSLRHTSSTACSLPQRPTIEIEVNGQRATVTQELAKAAPRFPQIPVRILRPGARASRSCSGSTGAALDPPAGRRRSHSSYGSAAACSPPRISSTRSCPAVTSPSAPSLLWTWDFVEPPS
jgi:hypothetical protein